MSRNLHINAGLNMYIAFCALIHHNKYCMLYKAYSVVDRTIKFAFKANYINK